MLPFLSRLTQPRAFGPQELSALYDRAAHSWQDGIDKLGFEAAYAHLVKSALPDLDPSARILDAGCGTGSFSQAVRLGTAHTGPLTLLDPSARMLGLAARQFPGARCQKGAIGDTQAPGAPFDLILCAHVIEHCDDAQTALRWLRDQLAPKGRLVLAISRPHWCTALVRWRWGHASYRPEEVLDMLRQTGFSAPRAIRFPSGPPSRLSCGYTAIT